MKKLFYQGESIENKISYLHQLCFLLMLPLDRFYSTIVLISLLMHSIFHLRKERLKAIDKNVFILQSVFWVSVLAACYAGSFNSSLNVISKQLAIFLFPLLFALMPLDIHRYRPGLLKGFSIGCSLVVLYLFMDAGKVIMYNHLPWKALFSAAFIHHNFSLPLELHATYFSMMLAMAFIYLLQQLLKGTAGGERILFIVCLLIITAGLIQLSSKAAFIALFIMVNIAVPWFVLQRKAAIRFLVISVSVSVLFVMTILSVKVFRERLLVDFKNDLIKATESEKLSWRIYRWDAAMDLIRQSPVIGHGTGSEIPLLRSLYYDRKMYSAYLASLNVHNQYLSFLINSGIIGLLIYLCTLFWGFWQAIKKKDLLLVSFMLLVTVVSMSEDILDVNKGIFFYGFFFSFLIMPGKRPAT